MYLFVQRVFIYFISKDYEDFSKGNSDYLDTWVESEATNFFQVSSEVKTSRKHLEKGEIFFFHLLGSDSNGHVNKPHSKQYRNNVNVADRIVQTIEERVTRFFVGVVQRVSRPSTRMKICLRIQ